MKAMLPFIIAVVFLAGCHASINQEKPPEWPPMTQTEVAGPPSGNPAGRSGIVSEKPELKSNAAGERRKEDLSETRNQRENRAGERYRTHRDKFKQHTEYGHDPA